MAETMLAARLDLDTRRFGVVRVPVPEPGAGEVLVEVAAAGVCLSDLHLVDGTLVPPGVRGPVTLGHEVAGTVVAVGAAVPADIPVGRRVVLHAGQACGRCDQCLRHRQPCPRARTRGVHCDGGWAQYALATADAVIPIPDGLPFEQAAIMPDAVSTPYVAIVDTAAVRPGQAVGVWGVGGLGAHAVQLLRLVGAAPIIAVDPLPAARLRALDVGADIALDPAAEDMVAEVLAATGGRGLHAAFDTAGVAAVREQALAALAPSGALVVIGLAAAPMVVRATSCSGCAAPGCWGTTGRAPSTSRSSSGWLATDGSTWPGRSALECRSSRPTRRAPARRPRRRPCPGSPRQRIVAGQNIDPFWVGEPARRRTTKDGDSNRADL